MGTIITLSNHSPFIYLDQYHEYDLTKEIKYLDEETNTYKKEKIDYLTGTTIGNYIISSHSSDIDLGEFIKMINNSEAFQNTIFIFYGDHDPRLSRDLYNYYYNYDPITDRLLDENDENYTPYNQGNYIMNKKTPLIVWSKNEQVRNLLHGEVDYPMGMIDILPTIGNMLGVESKYSLGHDIFNIKEENIVAFPDSSFITKDFVYDASHDDLYDIKTMTVVPNRDRDNQLLNIIKQEVNLRIDVSNDIIHYNT